jgi:hypothetical protein
MNRPVIAVVEVMERVQKQITTARMVGKIAVHVGSREIGNAIRQVIASVTDSRVVPTVADIDTETHLPLVNYPTLNAVDIVAQLETLSADELRAIADFEGAHRMRRTVLFKIDQLLST